MKKEIVSYCIQNKLSVLAYSPLERGLLTGKMKPGHQFAEGDHRANLFYFKNENIARTNDFLEKIKPIAEEKNVSLSQLVLAWTIEQPSITIALAGARNAAQATENAKAINIKLSKEEITFITSELNKLVLVSA